MTGPNVFPDAFSNSLNLRHGVIPDVNRMSRPDVSEEPLQESNRENMIQVVSPQLIQSVRCIEIEKLSHESLPVTRRFRSLRFLRVKGLFHFLVGAAPGVIEAFIHQQGFPVVGSVKEKVVFTNLFET